MSTYIIMILVMVWVMWFYLGFRLIDIRHDLRSMRLHMERIGNRRIRK